MEKNTTVDLTQEKDFQFIAHFGGAVPDLLLDEPEPLGSGKGLSPDQLLTASVANCLSASLLFSLRKFKQDPSPIKTHAEAIKGRNAEGRLRIVQIVVSMTLSKPASNFTHLDRVLSQFEDFCTVTQSIRQSVPVKITVQDSEGTILK